MIDAPALSRPVSPGWVIRGLLVLGLTALGDWLFYGRTIGLSLALFLIALAASVPLTNTVQRDGRARGLALAVLILGILPLLENVGLLAVLFGIGGLAAATVLMTGGLAPGRPAILGTVRRMLVAGPVQIVPDLAAGVSRQRAAGAPRWRWQPIIGWVTPILLAALFGVLFAAANPLIDAWLSAVSWSSLQPRVSVGRTLTWIVLAALAWPFVAVRLRDPAQAASSAADAPSAVPARIAAALGLGPAVVLRCLVLFNLLFALQSTLDILFLWGGLALPAGVTYAAYAHRGAYPLIVTALLAAAFVLTVMSPGGPGERSPVIRRLVYLWIGQNVLLVISAILRLDLYVAAYSLTLVRAAALVWMGLVAGGLVLIVARIALRRSNGWLLAANAALLTLVLYVCAFANLAALISDYNVAHSRHLGGGGGAFDLAYAMRLGPDALPAVDRYIAVAAGPTRAAAIHWRVQAARETARTMQDWRAWSFRDWRLARYLAATPAPPPTRTPDVALPGGDGALPDGGAAGPR